MILKKKWLNKISIVLLIVLFAMNFIAIFHSYKFTHFSQGSNQKTGTPQELSLSGKMNALIFGVSNPRPTNKILPSKAYKTIILESNRSIECWSINIAKSKGTIILFHGYGGEKSSMLDRSAIFNSLGYSTFLVDFMGSGNSEGNQTTIGFHEAEQVKTSIEYLYGMGETSIFLFGTSMGAVSVMKAIHENDLNVSGIILECPFGTMYETVCARFNSMKIPSFPMANLLVFWGGLQNGYWAFGHNPDKYASNISVPTLLLTGGVDEKVSLSETKRIFENLVGSKKLIIYPNAGHENYLNKYEAEWTNDIHTFLAQNN